MNGTSGNHFSEMKGDVGTLPHEKEGEQEDAYTKTENHSIPSPHLCFFYTTYSVYVVLQSNAE